METKRGNDMEDEHGTAGGGRKAKAGPAAKAGLLLLAALAAALPAAAAALSTDFAAALAESEARNVPLAVVWGNTSCGYCNSLSSALESSAALGKWLGGHPVLLVHKHEKPASKNADYLAAKAWILEQGKASGYPLVGLRWRKADGTVVRAAFTGRAGAMPATTPEKDLGAQFANSLDLYFGDYTGAGGTPEPELPGGDARFAAAGTADDRLEADASTGTVHVPLVRGDASGEAQNVLVAVAPSGETTRHAVRWAAGQDRQSVAVAMPARVVPGRRMALSLLGAGGAALAESSVAFVAEPANAASNPRWVGERTARTLPYGEWTMDFDAAREKVRTMGGQIVAMFAGPLWCPNCEAIERDVFDTARFRAWARREKLVLVLFDQGQASSPATAAGTDRGRLLSNTPSTAGRSGAAYLSRKGIDPLSEEVAAAIARTTELTARWLPPESAAARLSNPMLLLLDRDGGGVRARFTRQRGEGGAMDLEENMARLEDFVSLGGQDESKGWRTTTPLVLRPGEKAGAEFHVNSRTTFWRLEGLGGGYVSATAVPDGRAASDVRLALTAEDGTVLLSGRNRLLADRPLSELAPAGGALYLEARAFDGGAGVSAESFGRNSAFGATVSLRCDPDAARAAAPFASLSRKELKAANPNLFTRLTRTVPLVADGRLAGVLSVTLSAANRISARFAGGGAAASFSGIWQEADLASGAVSAALAARNGRALSLAMDADGAVSAVLDGSASGSAAAFAPEEFAGRYTVTLVPDDPQGGVGTLSVQVAASGRASVRGWVGAGVPVAASATPAGNADGTATLPVWRKTSKGTLALALRLRPGAAATWGSAGGMDTVGAEPGCAAVWTPAPGAGSEYAVYGGFWKAGASPLGAVGDFDLPGGGALALSVGGEALAGVTATKSGFSFARGGALRALSVSRTTGEVTGQARLVRGGLTVTAQLKGVMLPGWHDCGCTGGPVLERPFASGSAWYSAGGETHALPFHLETAGEE